jgi:hypothetical protein
MKSAVSTVVIACLACLTACSSYSGLHERQNIKVAFQYFKPSKVELAFLSRFDIVVTGKFLDSETVALLKSKKVKLLYYDWLPAFYYCGGHTDWEEMAYQNRLFWTLDPAESDPNPMGDAYGCTDFFYDMAADDMIDARVEHIVSEIQTHQYDGVFFDWGSGWYAFQENNYQFLIKEFPKRHPGIDYNERASEFLKKLRERNVLIMLNGGFRSEGSKMDTYADFDIVESMFTTTDCKKSFEIYTAQEGVRKACETTFNAAPVSLNLAASLPAKAQSVNPKIRFIFLNYAFPFYKDAGKKTLTKNKEYTVYEKTPDRQAIYYALACSYMGDSTGFVNGPEVSLDSVMDDVYFLPIGKAVGKVMKIMDNVYVRYFSKGLVIVSEGDTAFELAVPVGKSGVFDLYEKKRVEIKNNKLAAHPASRVYPSGSKRPIGRIYLYEH